MILLLLFLFGGGQVAAEMTEERKLALTFYDDSSLLYGAVTESETKVRAVESAKNYILGNRTGIKESVKAKDKSLQCSAEGHVSHIYSDRMSSRPLGWSRTGEPLQIKWPDCVYIVRIRGICRYTVFPIRR